MQPFTHDLSCCGIIKHANAWKQNKGVMDADTRGDDEV